MGLTSQRVFQYLFSYLCCIRSFIDFSQIPEHFLSDLLSEAEGNLRIYKPFFPKNIALVN